MRFIRFIGLFFELLRAGAGFSGFILAVHVASFVWRIHVEMRFCSVSVLQICTPTGNGVMYCFGWWGGRRPGGIC